MTGMYAGSSGVPLNCNSSRPISSLRQDIPGFSDVLAQAGYETGYIGKWHLDHPQPNDPQNPGHYVESRRPVWDAYTPKERRQGFKYWYSYGTFDVHKNPHYWDTEGNRYDPGVYSPKHEADKSISYLKNTSGQRDPEKPFALFVSMNPPHNPYRSLDDVMKKDYALYKDIPLDELLIRDNADLGIEKARAAPFYFSHVTGVDREFGRIVQQLKEMGEYDNTIIVYTSDHGETLASHGLKDPKNCIYSEAFDVPFLIRLPEMEIARTDDLLMTTPDIMPTILGLMGLDKRIPTHLHGSNYARAILGDKEAHRPKSVLYSRNVNGETDDQGNVISYFPVARGVKTHNFTLEFTIDRTQNLESTKFFNDNIDPYQLNNIPVEKDDPVVKGLLTELAYWLEKSEDPWHKEKILSDWIPY